ncbi:MAG: exosome complex RNA-binding protein Rrp4 [Candidatus Woesearchaeota archaeon]|jgi:exosome complex component RRP4|nr:exosome complex RNA-binding protein Rrp4 [Candidatus Woesearchaeota archaeon]MDP7199041.1 exosome complex RNA-binding protein Rrp4 [Candidatus Woesearchaeota archaeon]MDP7467705.1 exosome complex RNA-binding protein Rrp4 [Candidatus Woesearchaeota archaeon]MDP7646789.1 exosome complex RNA-binding protein Rrp4 [Candidatus Woesearchaeota archaeon]
MEKVIVKNRDVVVPGEVLAEGMGFVPGDGTYREGDNVRAARLGLMGVDGKVVKLTPLAGPYVHKVNDRIIARVKDILMTGWRIDTNSAYSAVLGLAEATSDFIPRGADLKQYFDIDDWVICKISKVTSQKLIDVSMKGPGLRKLIGGRVIKVNPAKVPRIIGKEGSMISLIKEGTGADIQVGQNGFLWIKAEPEKDPKVEAAIRKIEAEAHLPGLTEKVKELFK